MRTDELPFLLYSLLTSANNLVVGLNTEFGTNTLDSIIVLNGNLSTLVTAGLADLIPLDTSQTGSLYIIYI